MWEQVRRLLKPRGAFVTTASQPFTSALTMSNPDWFRTEWIWHKNAGSNFANTDWHPMKEHESVLVFGDGPTTFNPIRQRRAAQIREGYTNHSNTGKRQTIGMAHNRGFTVTDGKMRVPSSVQMFNRERGLHPTQKPVALYAYLIRTYTNPGDTVLDFCMGSGTTGVAAIKEGRNFVGVELDERYFAIAQKRIAEAQMQPLLLEVTA